MRAAPRLAPDEALRGLAAFADGEVLARVPAPDSPALALGFTLTGKNRPTSASLTSEAGLFQEADIPAIVCGPGNARQAHQPNEFVDAAVLASCEEFLRRLAKWARQARPSTQETP